jgi:hypothetical protein
LFVDDDDDDDDNNCTATPSTIRVVNNKTSTDRTIDLSDPRLYVSDDADLAAYVIVFITFDYLLNIYVFCITVHYVIWH